MDLTKYGVSPYAAGSPNRADQNMSAIAAALRGLLGQDEPGSVLDPATAHNKRINDAVQLGSIISDLAPVKGAATGGMALAGALRRGGRPDLFLSHGANANMLMRNGTLLRELTHPSMAITKDYPMAPWGDVMLIPREGKFDPRTSTSALHDMDAWTPSYSSAYAAGMGASTINTPAGLAQARLADRFENRWPKGGLNQAGTEAMGANRFPSFEAFENAKRGGVKRLEGGKPVSKLDLDYLARLSDDWGLPKPEILDNLIQGDPDLINGALNVGYGQRLMQTLRQTPQDYAELKVFGHVPITPDNFAGALVKEGGDPALLRALEDRGLHYAEYNPYSQASLDKLGDEANLMQSLSRMRMTPKAPSGADLERKALADANILRGLTPTGEPKKLTPMPKNFDSWADWAKDYWYAWNTPE